MLAFGAILVILMMLDTVADAAVIASFGTSSFIVLAMPHQEVSSTRRVILGSLIGTVVALSADLIRGGMEGLVEGVPLINSGIFFGALAVGVSMFLMVMTNTEHPPAATLPLRIAMEDCSHSTILEAAFLRRFMIASPMPFSGKLSEIARSTPVFERSRRAPNRFNAIP